MCLWFNLFSVVSVSRHPAKGSQLFNYFLLHHSEKKLYSFIIRNESKVIFVERNNVEKSMDVLKTNISDVKSNITKQTKIKFVNCCKRLKFCLSAGNKTSLKVN